MKGAYQDTIKIDKRNVLMEKYGSMDPKQVG